VDPKNRRRTPGSLPDVEPGKQHGREPAEHTKALHALILLLVREPSCMLPLAELNHRLAESDTKISWAADGYSRQYGTVAEFVRGQPAIFVEDVTRHTVALSLDARRLLARHIPPVVAKPPSVSP
jgi:hypothetical protein